MVLYANYVLLYSELFGKIESVYYDTNTRTLQPHRLEILLRTYMRHDMFYPRKIDPSFKITTTHILGTFPVLDKVDFRLLCIISFFILQYLFIFTPENPKYKSLIEIKAKFSI